MCYVTGRSLILPMDTSFRDEVNTRVDGFAAAVGIRIDNCDFLRKTEGSGSRDIFTSLCRWILVRAQRTCREIYFITPYGTPLITTDLLASVTLPYQRSRCLKTANAPRLLVWL